MKHILSAVLILFWIISAIFPIDTHANYNRNQNPVKIVDDIKDKANKNKSDQVQNTDYDNTSSRSCSEVSLDDRFTISRTLCNIKDHSKDYLQYIMYVWLTAATILLIWNGFKIVTSSDREKQVATFKKNLTYIIIWVVLLTGFYYIIDIFVSVVNIIAE